jgi:hypothetical protein
MRTLKLAVLSLALCTAAVPAFSQDHQDHKAADPKAAEKPGHGQPMDQAMMEAWMKAATPGEQHKHLARGAGKWATTQKMWMAPGQPPMETTGTMEGEMILGGRYLHTVYKASMMGQPFEGQAFEAYDNVTQELISAWIDTMGTGILISRGKCDDPACKTVTVSGTMADPMGGPTVTMRQVTTWIDNDNYKFEIWGTDPQGGEAKMMEMTAKRKK